MEAPVKTVELQDFGIMTEERKPDSPTYNLGKLYAYCEQKGVRPIDLTESEREQFRTN